MSEDDSSSTKDPFSKAAAVPLNSQAAMDNLAGVWLDKAIMAGMPGVMRWMKMYTQCADQGMNARADIVLPKLAEAGYKAKNWDSQAVGTKEDYGHKVIGVVMNALSQGRRPPAGKHFNNWLVQYDHFLGRADTPGPV
jgi:hypothetical protein